MMSIKKVLLTAFSFASAAAAQYQQSTASAYVWTPVEGWLQHVGNAQGDFSMKWHVLDPALADPFASATMPYDSPGEILALGSRVVSCGTNSQLGKGYLARSELQTAGGAGSITVIESVDLGALEPSELEYNAAEQGLFLFDMKAMKLYHASWDAAQWQALPQSFTEVADFSTMSEGDRPVWLTEPLEGEDARGVYLRIPTDSFKPWRWDRAYHVYRDTFGVWLTEIVGSSGPPTSTSTGWEVRDSLRVPVDGPLFLRNVGGGTFCIEEMATGNIVLGGTIPLAPGWHMVSFSPGTFFVGKRYRVTGAGAIERQPFWPSFRFGDATDASDYHAELGWFRQDLFAVGNAEFRAKGRIEWRGQGDPVVAATQSYLWVKLWDQEGTPYTTMPGGEVVLENPDATLTPEFFGAVMSPPGYLPLRATVPVAEDDTLENLAVLFQWAAILPTNDIIVSDIFGGVILANPSPAASSSGGGSTTPTSEQRMRAGLEWVRGMQSLRNHRQLYNTIVRRLGTQ